MKTVFTPSMTIHVWAQQKQAVGRSAGRNSSVFFEGPTIFSYGWHYVMGRFVTNKRGQRALLVNNNRSSVTTNKHMERLRRAIPGGLPQFPVRYPRSNDHPTARADLEQSVHDALEKASRARLEYRVEVHLSEARRITSVANKYAEFFGLRWRLPEVTFTPEEKGAMSAAVKARNEEQRKRERDAEVKRLRAVKAAAVKLAEAEAEALTKWLAGEKVSCYLLPRDSATAFLRVHGSNIETSQGAEVPVPHAKRLWPVIQRCMAQAKGYVRNGHTEHVGHFAVDEITPTGDLKIGCHFIKHDQVARIATELGIA